MPELPEVESIVRRLRPELVGRTIEGVELVRRDILSGEIDVEAVVKRTVVQVARYGKGILVGFDPPLWLVIRLGMTGRCLVAPRGSPRPPHTHAVVTVSGAPWELQYRDPRRFGGWRVVRSLLEIKAAPDALALRRATWSAILDAHRGQLRALLMNQRILAGLGNIYTNEALFAARLHPKHEASQLADGQREALYRAIKSTLRRGIRHGGSTIRDYVTPDGERGGFQKRFRVYGRAGQPCRRRCGARIEKLPAAPESQPAFFCPRCQPFG
jgi:formamidopyrimidine-DNA glycosylase